MRPREIDAGILKGLTVVDGDGDEAAFLGFSRSPVHSRTAMARRVGESLDFFSTWPGY